MKTILFVNERNETAGILIVDDGGNILRHAHEKEGYNTAYLLDGDDFKFLAYSCGELDVGTIISMIVPTIGHQDSDGNF